MQAMAHDLGDCPLCGRRLVAGGSVNQHHLVPRSRSGRDTVALHRICHSAIHATLSEKELEWQYHSMERLRDHPQLRRFIAWVRRKPPEFWVRTRRGR
jgi:hypothetical protein